MKAWVLGRSALLGASLLLLVGLVAVPVLAKPPTSPPGQSNKPEKTPEAPVTYTGTLESVTDADGRASYTLSVGGATYQLSAGPSWYWGENHPLRRYVGQKVTIDGEQAEGATEVDVLRVNGTELRGSGKPPWAGGWKAVGERHPGWSQAKADRFAARFGDCFPPGHCKAKSPPTPAAP